MGNLGEDSITIDPCFEADKGKLWSFDSEKEEMECRICQEEEKPVNLEVPCACSGSVKYAHRKCVQEWCNEKGNTICEICQQPYRNGYTVIPRHVHGDQIGSIGLRDGDWRITLEMQNSVTSLDSEFEGFYSKVTPRCRSAAMILLLLVFLLHTWAITVTTEDDDAYRLLMASLLRAAGFLLLCYIMARARKIQLGRQAQDQERVGVVASTRETAIFIFFFVCLVLFSWGKSGSPRPRPS